MKKLFIVSAIFFSAFQFSFSQTVQKGDKLIGFGVGPANNYDGWGGVSPAVRFTFEVAAFKAGPGVITLGGLIGYAHL